MIDDDDDDDDDDDHDHDHGCNNMIWHEIVILSVVLRDYYES